MRSQRTTFASRCRRTPPGAKINRDIFGQFAEHLGTGIYGGVWVGPNSPIPNVRGIRSDVVQALRALRSPQRALAGRLLRRRISLARGDRPGFPQAGPPQLQLGRSDRAQQLRHARVHGFRRPDRRRTSSCPVNVGSGTVQEAADWLEYLTADKPTSLAKERAANGHPAPYKIKYLGLGNENWGCGGAMSPDHYVEEMKRYAHYLRNLNPARRAPTR